MSKMKEADMEQVKQKDIQLKKNSIWQKDLYVECRMSKHFYWALCDLLHCYFSLSKWN